MQAFVVVVIVVLSISDLGERRGASVIEGDMKKKRALVEEEGGGERGGAQRSRD